MPQEKDPQIFGYFKVTEKFNIYTSVENGIPQNIIIFLDFLLALTPVIDETINYKMYIRNSFITSRRLLLINWLVMANILSHAYKGSILSSLINIHYEDPLDTIQQMVESSLPFYVLGNTACVWVTRTDPRDTVKQLNARRFDMPWGGVTEEKYLQM